LYPEDISMLYTYKSLHLLATCSPVALGFSVARFVSVKLYCGIINQDSTLVVC